VARVVGLVALISLTGLQSVQAEPRGKSPWKAGALSLLLPGAGHFYLGKAGRARAFVSAEASVWAGYYLLRRQANLAKDDYRLFASHHAGAASGEDADTYYEDVSWYDDSYDCNQDYRQPFRYTDDLAWEWDSWENRERMKKMIRRSRDWRSRAKLSTSFAILTRVASAVDAVTGALTFKVGDAEVRIDPRLDEVSMEASLRW